MKKIPYVLASTVLVMLPISAIAETTNPVVCERAAVTERAQITGSQREEIHQAHRDSTGCKPDDEETPTV